MTWLVVLALGVGAGLGTQLRFAAERIQAAARARRAPLDVPFPWATLVVNAVGSGALGALVGAHAAGTLDATWLAVGGAGVCGGLTTFSTLAVDVMVLVRARRWGRATAFVAAHVVSGLVLFVGAAALAAP